MEYEFELHRAYDEAVDALQNVCPRCKNIVIGNFCPTCKKALPQERYYDPDWDDYAKKVMAESEEFFESFNRPDNWTEVKDEDANA